MSLVYENSLGATMDAVNDALFHKRTIKQADAVEAARWIASRQGLPGSYRGMFAPTDSDFEKGVRVYTGERTRSGASTSHILSEEACRTLCLLKPRDVSARTALKRAQAVVASFMDGTGTYCCGICSTSLWRHLSAGGYEGAECLLESGLRALKSHRDGEGWRPYPFWYTVLTLLEIDTDQAREELRYAEAFIRRYERNARPRDYYAERRVEVARRVIARL
ncbi:MAG: hypothetical protein GYA63_04210 [Armatimonadetes bacterium]|nr:hypothetical protein [Armatimonadota bacterium]